jgi:hypothetical protein
MIHLGGSELILCYASLKIYKRPIINIMLNR